MTKPPATRNSGGRPSRAPGLPSWSAASLKRAMREAGHQDTLSLQGELMRRFGLQLQVKRYLDPKRRQRPTLEVAAAIAQVLNQPIEYFLSWPRRAAA